MSMTGAQMIVRALESEGVEHVFGIPGGSVIPLYDALKDASFTTILTRHEQAACHAADSYARVTGKTGVCIATSGPGATNIVTGLANAHMDSVPLVVLTGQAPTSAIGTDAFQEADIFGCSLPLVKHSFLIRSLEELPRALKGAFLIASTGRPGPVLVDIPSDIQKASGTFEYPEDMDFPGYNPEGKEDLHLFEEAAEALATARRPVIIAGGGAIISKASKELFSLATEAEIPVATTLMGKGSFPEDHPLSLGMVGMHGTPWANTAVSKADLVLAAGVRFSDRSTGDKTNFASGAKIIHADIDKAEFGKNVRTDFPLQGPLPRILKKFIESPGGSGESHEKWLEEIHKVRETYAGQATPGPKLDPVDVIHRVRSRVAPEDIVTTEVGQHQMWAALHWKTSTPRTFITSGGLGTMGYGLPAAIGAAFARPGRPVTCLSGDGSFFMNVQELETCVRYGLPIRVVVFNNGSLGMVRQWQELFWNKRYVHTCVEPACSISRVARAFGFSTWTVLDSSQLDDALDGAFAAKGPSLVECPISTEELVYPMVPAGGRLEEFLHPSKI
jgi:acetolactate synthase-1/2/3 large subunit